MDNLQEELEQLKKQKECPPWMTLAGYTTISRGYRLKGETPRKMYERVAKSAAKHIELDGYTFHKKAGIFFEAMWRNWLCPASPVLANLGLGRGLPISCYGNDTGDSIQRIMECATELALLTKGGGGVGMNLQRVRPRGSLIRNGENGTSEGIVPFMKIYDSTVIGISQGSTRRGAASANLNIEHGDWHEFVRMRRPEGDVNRQCQNLHHCTVINDDFMQKVIAGDHDSRVKWAELMKARMETGEPYIMYKDNVNKANPEAYKKNELEVDMTNICCLTGDTLVATSDGPQKIENLVGKEVTVYDGKKWVKCSNFEKRGVTNELYEIELKSGAKFKVTPNHRFLINKNYNDIRRGNFTEKTAKELEVGDFIDYHTEESHGNLSEPGAYLKGFMLGDGTFGKKPILNLHFTKYSCESALIKSCKEIKIDSNLRSDCILEPSFSEEINIEDSKAYGTQIFKKMKGLSARKNELNYWVTEAKQGLGEFVLRWDEKTKLSFLSGLFDADGTLGKSLQISQKSKKLIHDIQVVVNSLGYSCSIDKGQENFRLTIGSYDSKKIMDRMNCKRLVWENELPNRRTTGYRAVKSIKKLNTEFTDVYCPNIASTGYFALSNGTMTGNSEITLHTDDEHSFICCLASLNLNRYDEWKNEKIKGLSLPAITTIFLNAVLNEFIENGSQIKGLEKVVRHAVKGRAIGIGVLGWHTLLQSKGMAFESFPAMMLNSEVFKFIHEEAVKQSQELAKELGEPEWCKGTGMYNSHLIAIAPTRSNSIISGDVSPGIEPIIANAYVDKTAKGTFIRKNELLLDILEKHGKNNNKVWKDIARKHGSVQHLDFLSDDEKNVFKTAYEINQKALIQQAAQRQKFICQSQSLNLFFPVDVKPSYFNKIHIEAWKLGVKTLYYCRSKAGIQADVASRDDECLSCEG